MLRVRAKQQQQKQQYQQQQLNVFETIAQHQQVIRFNAIYRHHHLLLLLFLFLLCVCVSLNRNPSSVLCVYLMKVNFRFIRFASAFRH